MPLLSDTVLCMQRDQHQGTSVYLPTIILVPMYVRVPMGDAV
jgi:hypothetical protein